MGLHQVDMAHIGKRDAFGSGCRAHNDAQALGLGGHRLFQTGRKGVRVDPIEDLAHPLLFRAVFLARLESLGRTVVHRRIFTPDTPLVDQTLALESMGFQHD